MTVHPHGRGDNWKRQKDLPVTPAVHPHGRGDNTSALSSLVGSAGSPPRAWGQHYGSCPLAINGGGSPPRAWGQQGCRPGGPNRHRFTPTGVGTTPTPQTCFGAASGSPPRAWGQQEKYNIISVSLNRFTPTGVGTTITRWAPQCNCSVHPHGRGDNYNPVGAAVQLLGSPPRAWGQLRARRHNYSDHCGSPPRAWGQRWHVAGKLIYRRFTPTGVGTAAFSAGRRP